MNICPFCDAVLNYPPPCETCRRKAEAEQERLGPSEDGKPRGLSLADPRLFNIPNTDQDYRL